MESMNMQIIARMKSDFPTKFGIPRQSGLVEQLRSTIIFEPEFRNADALRGIEGFSHLWLIWQFSESVREDWSPTVRPPRLGGNTRMGVFATRSPFRPNRLGLSSVKLLGVSYDAGRLVLQVAGADMADGTPVYDVKPYVAYSDAHPDARCGFVDSNEWRCLKVEFPEYLRTCFADDDYAALHRLLELDPRPQYHSDPSRVYGMVFAGYDVRFRVSENNVLEVVEVVKT